MDGLAILFRTRRIQSSTAISTTRSTWILVRIPSGHITYEGLSCPQLVVLTDCYSIRVGPTLRVVVCVVLVLACVCAALDDNVYFKGYPQEELPRYIEVEKPFFYLNIFKIFFEYFPHIFSNL